MRKIKINRERGTNFYGIHSMLSLLLACTFAGHAAAIGFKLASEEYLTQTINGQKYSFKTNPSLEQSIKVERISDYEYHHRPRGE